MGLNQSQIHDYIVSEKVSNNDWETRIPVLTITLGFDIEYDSRGYYNPERTKNKVQALFVYVEQARDVQ